MRTLVPTEASTDSDRVHETPSPAPGRRPGVRALGACLVAALVYIVMASGILPAAVSLLVLVLALVLPPTSRELSRRLVVNGSLLLGLAPVLWSWPLPVDRAALLVALGAGGTAWQALGRVDLRAGIHSVLPRTRPTDLLVPAGGLLGLVVMGRWALPQSPRQALELLVPGVDNAAHFSMFSMVLRHGATTSALGPSPDGSPWSFGEYPQGFHALVATLSELVHPGLVSGEQLLVAYSHGVALTVVLGLCVVTAAIVSLPFPSGRGAAAVPVVVMTWAAFLWHPGQELLSDGFATFWLSAAAAATALLLVLSVRRVATLANVSAVAALLVCVVYAWAPLVVIAGPAVLALFLPRGQPASAPEQRRSRRQAVATVVVLVVAAGFAAKTVLGLFLDVSVSSVVVATGGIHSTGALQTFALLLVGLVVLPAAPSLGRRLLGAEGAGADDWSVGGRARVLTLSLVAGLAAATLLLVEQMRSLGLTSYYFLKFVMGFELVLAALVPAVVALLVCQAPALRVGRLPGWAFVVLASLVASQAFGVVHGPVALLGTDRPGTAQLSTPFSGHGLADGLLDATRGRSRGTGFDQDYLAIGRTGAPLAFYADNWYHALLVSQSSQVVLRTQGLVHHVDDVRQAAPVARGVLRDHPGTQLVVAPEYAASLRARLGTRLGTRVTTWPVEAAVRLRS